MKTHSPEHPGLGRPPQAASPFPSLLDIAAGDQAVDWLWPGWIPRGMLTLLAGAPGTGKSLVALDLARRVIAGLPFPDGAPFEGRTPLQSPKASVGGAPSAGGTPPQSRNASAGGTPSACPGAAAGQGPGANVILVDAEGPLSLLDQRARAFDIDRSRLFLMMPGDYAFDLASAPQQKRLVSMIRGLRPVLLIVDSLSACTPGGESIPTALHTLLAVLSSLARELDVAVLLIHHLRKRAHAGRSASPPPVTVDDLRGSSHIVAVARSILALSPVAPAPGTGHTARPPAARRLEVIKSNLCRRPLTLGLLFEGDGAGAPILHYTGPYTAPPPPPSRVELCASWILDHLAAAGQPLRPADLLQAAAEAGFSQSTLYRARRALGDEILTLGRGAHDPARRWTLSPTPPAKR